MTFLEKHDLKSVFVSMYGVLHLTMTNQLLVIQPIKYLIIEVSVVKNVKCLLYISCFENSL